MIKPVSAVVMMMSAHAAIAEETRQLDTHEHGVGHFNVAFDAGQIAMELHAPGADIVGFEYAATRAEDRAQVDAAVATLARPLDLFSLPDAAGCSVVEARASLESEVEDDHDDHAEHEDDDHDHDGHAEHKEEGHDHDGHAEHKEEGHDHEDHADHKEEGHDHDDHAAHKDEGHDHDDHVKEAAHTEFHAEYLLTCANPEQANMITFGYFEAFPNALELEVQVISDRGASAFEVERAVPTLDLRDLF